MLERASVVIGADGRSSHVARAVGASSTTRSRCSVGLLLLLERPAGRGFETSSARPGLAAARRTTASRWSSSVGPAEAWPSRPTSRATIKTLELAPTSPTASAARTRGAVLRRIRAQLLPQAVRAGLGTRRRRGVQQGPDHRPGHQRRLRDAEAVPTRSTTHSAAGGLRRGHGRLPADRDDHVLPIYEFTTQLATLEPPPPEMQQLLGAVHGNEDAMDAFVSLIAGTVSPVEFFDPANIGSLHG